MNKRGTGVTFIAIAAFLFSAKYISAAIFGSSAFEKTNLLKLLESLDRLFVILESLQFTVTIPQK